MKGSHAALLALLALAPGCVIVPIPTGRRSVGAQLLEERHLALAACGTQREDVLLGLGLPDYLRGDGSAMTWARSGSNVTLLWGAGAGAYTGRAGATPVEWPQALQVAFDPAGRVAQSRLIEGSAFGKAEWWDAALAWPAE